MDDSFWDFEDYFVMLAYVSLGSVSLLERVGCDIATGHCVAHVYPSDSHHVTECFPHLIRVACSMNNASIYYLAILLLIIILCERHEIRLDFDFDRYIYNYIYTRIYGKFGGRQFG